MSAQSLAAISGPITGPSTNGTTELGALIRTLPNGVSRNWFNASSAEPISPNAGESCDRSIAPASVSDTLRVMRLSRRMPPRTPTLLAPWLIAEAVTLKDSYPI